MDEFELIARYFAPLSGAGGFDLKDDAAVIPARPGFDLIVTTDSIAAGTDFFAFDPADTVARKALRVNLSDLAAKGATPYGYLLSLALPCVTGAWLEAFAQGLALDQAQYGVSLLGGDTARTEGPLCVSITAFGFVPEGGMIRRNGARAGDDIYVTGIIGDSDGGLAIFRRETHTLTEEQRDSLTGRYRLPAPPVGFGAGLCGLASASVDISDGLMADLGHVARASDVKLTLEAAAIPRSEALRALWGDGEDAIIRAVTAGDDYQIAFTAPPSRYDSIMALAARTQTGVTRIGSADAGEGVVLHHLDRVLPVPKPGYSHF